MKKTVKNRLITIIIILAFSSVGVVLLLSAMKDNITFFYSPSEIANASNINSKTIRIGGLVKKLQYKSPSEIEFAITDITSEIKVLYFGVVPSLFRENQGVVVVGKFEGKFFIAKELLIKHDETYKPPYNNKTKMELQ
ncbi:MAG: cytochrome c maturation protein CcmE [Rickettsiaceae bacterium]|nr:cytochrome c maturation protein CcmE [Rickettsiaceae bacterium]